MPKTIKSDEISKFVRCSGVLKRLSFYCSADFVNQIRPTVKFNTKVGEMALRKY
jgi:hypothetical protein